MMTDQAIRDVGEDEVEGLCALFRVVFHAEVSTAAWLWKYHDKALDGHVNVVLAEGDRILGHAGAVILPGSHDGERVPLAQICDVMLAPDARGGAGPRGPYATLIQGLIDTLQARIPDGLFFGFPGERPFRLGERLGFYRRLGHIYEQRRPTSPSGGSFRRLSPLDWTDRRLDLLWSRGAARAGCRIVRDARYLDWRYARNPHRTYQLLGVHLGWWLVGWVVVHLQDGEVLVVDRWLDERTLEPVLRALVRWGHAQGAAQIVWWPGDASQLVPSPLARDTGLVGGVMPASAPRFATCSPSWQPGDTDVR
jgi:hypothetical protein